MAVYMPGDSIDPTQFPSILAIGDSWFWYPKNNILQAMIEHPDVPYVYSNIQVLGYNGACLSQYVGLDPNEKNYTKELAYELDRKQSQYYSAVLISGGGNDAVNYQLALKPDCSGISRAEDCIHPENLDALLQQLSRALHLLLHEILWTFDKQERQVDIFIHGYDYPIPDGRAFGGKLKTDGPWLKRAMDICLVTGDMAQRQRISDIMIDALNNMLSRFANEERGVHFIDSRGILSKGADHNKDWANEMHPTFSGFKKVFEQSWLPVLRQHGYTQ